MSTDTIEQAPEVETPVEAPPEPDATTTVEQTFRYYAVVEVPEQDFRAFIRLPNQFQHADIRQKAMAAKARRVRQLRDPEADASVILEGELDELFRANDKAPIIDELLSKDWWKDHLESIKDAREDEAFGHIDDDERRLAELEAKPAEERPAEEYEELERHVAKFHDLVETKRNERQKPRRDAFEAMDLSDLIDLLREHRIGIESNNVFNLNFSMWEWLSGTYHVVEEDGKAKPGERYFASVEEVANADPATLARLGEAYRDLESSFQRGLVGNS